MEEDREIITFVLAAAAGVVLFTLGYFCVLKPMVPIVVGSARALGGDFQVFPVAALLLPAGVGAFVSYVIDKSPYPAIPTLLAALGAATAGQ